jgi:sulfhydrogenase subunit beta (sulfur reductase)
MSEIFVEKDGLKKSVERLMERYRVFGPVFQGQYHECTQLGQVSDLDLTFQNTRLSPKGLFHPHSDRMFTYSLKKDDPETSILKEAPQDYSPRVVVGIRPCDAKAFQLDDVNFDTDTFKDPWWVKRRECTTLVGLACNEPCNTCFCTTMGTGPFDSAGLDVLLVEVGDGYMAEPLTDKGRALLKDAELKEAASAEVKGKAADLKKTAEQSLGKLFSMEAIAARESSELFNAAFWEEVQFACINCGTCTFLCPTCWCFDIQDEVCGDQGDRLRLWDSCMFPLFTHHGSGHNPRSQKLQRVRQRFMHKLKYYQDKYHRGAACVGCGRCVTHCPVNIDIRQVAQLMSASCIC